MSASADDFRKAYSASQADLQVTRGLAGWAVGAELGPAVTAWQQFVAGLADQVDAFGDGLTRSAVTLSATDQAAADQVRRAGQQPR